MNRIIDPLWRPGGVFKFPLSFVVFSFPFFSIKGKSLFNYSPKKTPKKKICGFKTLKSTIAHSYINWQKKCSQLNRLAHRLKE